jgi:hypothetical protein
MTLRRVALREAQHLAASGHCYTLSHRAQDQIYLQVDGHLCPTREPRAIVLMLVGKRWSAHTQNMSPYEENAQAARQVDNAGQTANGGHGAQWEWHPRYRSRAGSESDDDADDTQKKRLNFTR